MRVGQAIFVAAFGSEVEEVVGADEDVETARVSGIGVEDFVRRRSCRRRWRRALLRWGTGPGRRSCSYLAAGHFLFVNETW